MNSTNSQRHQLQERHAAYSPLPKQQHGQGVSTPHEWFPSIPWNAINCNEAVDNGVLDASRSLAHQSLLHLPKTRGEAHIQSFLSDNFGRTNQNPIIDMENSLLMNGFTSAKDESFASSTPRNKYIGGLCYFSSTNTGLNQLPFSSSSSSSSFPAIEYYLRSVKSGSHLSPHDQALAKEQWESSASPPNSSKKESDTMNGVTGIKRSGHDSEPPKSSDHAGAKKSSLKASRPAFKVRKEKLGDRIAALHQLVSPFGKTDTASVLTEAIGYIQFLQDQIHKLCSRHVKPLPNNPCRRIQMGLNEEGGKEEAKEDLRRRGLCLVPLSWTSFITANQSDASHHHYF
ncbi:hypothetical protein Nepgr_008338 [Nepenthes gracilis]|uniref:BHLH domain-containing protein n=1 Tax=Nepenthes gracilis TaxID=150966 RepID=A0AAD3S8J9_NEPGR|nr:hypothetical protein Nepgr_008338 [Nepenthes gracilis]